MDVRSTANITKRTKARRGKRDGNLEQIQADISQILQIELKNNATEDLASATAL